MFVCQVSLNRSWFLPEKVIGESVSPQSIPKIDEFFTIYLHAADAFLLTSLRCCVSESTVGYSQNQGGCNMFVQCRDVMPQTLRPKDVTGNHKSTFHFREWHRLEIDFPCILKLRKSTKH